jgi:hypothetical protein
LAEALEVQLLMLQLEEELGTLALERVFVPLVPELEWADMLVKGLGEMLASLLGLL